MLNPRSTKVTYSAPEETIRTIKEWSLGCVIPWKCVEKNETVIVLKTKYRTVDTTTVQCCPGWMNDGKCATRKLFPWCFRPHQRDSRKFEPTSQKLLMKEISGEIQISTEISFFPQLVLPAPSASLATSRALVTKFSATP